MLSIGLISGLKDTARIQLDINDFPIPAHR